MIDASERSDFVAAVRRHGLDEEDFELCCVEDPVPAGGVFASTGKAVAKHKKSGVERTYQAGYRTAWVVAFEHDLEKRVFS